MRGIEGEQVLVRIYLGESKTAHRQPLYREVLELLRREGLAGATVLKGWQHVEQLLGKVDALMTGGLVMTERAHVVRYTAGS